MSFEPEMKIDFVFRLGHAYRVQFQPLLLYGGYLTSGFMADKTAHPTPSTHPPPTITTSGITFAHGHHSSTNLLK